MKILFVDSNDQLRQLYTVYLDNILSEATVIEQFSAKRAIEALEMNPRYDLVLSDYQLSDGTGGEIYRFIKQHRLGIPFVLFSSSVPEMHAEFESFTLENPKNGSITKPISPAAFRDSILKILQPSVVATRPVKAFQQVRMMNFWRFNKVLCDVYMKLSDRKYVKIINKNTVYTYKDLEKLFEKDQKYLFIRNEDFEKFSVTFHSTPFLTMDTSHMTEAEVEDALLATHRVLNDLVAQVGVSQEVVAMAGKNVDEVIKKAETSKTLKKLIVEVREAKNYIYDHSYLVSAFCCAMASKLDCDYEASAKKLCTAAIFHDITLNNSELAMIQETTDPKLHRFSKSELKQFENHPHEVAKMLQDARLFSPEVEEIIIQHHENITQTGFPEKIHPSKISMLVAIFIIAHDYVGQLYANEFSPEKFSTISARLKRKYTTGNFEAPMAALLQYLGA